MALIVVQAHKHIGGAAFCGEECGVGRDGPFDIEAALARQFDGRANDRFLLVAKQPVLAGMRVEPQHADLRLVAIDAANAPHRLRAEFERVENAFLCEQLRHLRVGHVSGDKHTTHLAGILQHACALGVGEFGKNLRVPRERNARRAQGFLVERRRGHRRHLSTERGIDGVLHIRVSRTPRGGIDGAGLKLIQPNRAQVQHTRLRRFCQATYIRRRFCQATLLSRLLQYCPIPKHNWHTPPCQLGILKQMQAYLRPHPCGIPHRYSYFGKAHVYAVNLTTEALGAQGFLCNMKMPSGAVGSRWVRSFGC